MFSIRKINPMVRAVGTMGAVMAVVGGVTFASLTSNTVALSTNTMSSASATLAIGAGTSCPTGGTTIPGFTNVKLVPGTTSAPVPFCLDNIGDVPLNITAQIPTSFTGSQIPPSQVTLTLTCPTIGTISKTLDNFGGPVAFSAPLPTATPINCNATALLNASFSASGQTVNTFDVNFVGNQ